MSGFLLDTNVISEPVAQSLCTSNSAVLVMKTPEGPQSFWETKLCATPLPVSEPIANRWGSLCAQAQLSGRPLSIIDALLAATALVHNLTVVSRNVSDFSVVGLAVVNPWEQA